jgi:ABC-type branched-subunit amino acid transport system ATPase component
MGQTTTLRAIMGLPPGEGRIVHASSTESFHSDLATIEQHLSV